MRITIPLCVLTLSSFAAAQWTQYTPANSPSPRIEAQMAYDSIGGQTILFGGADNSGFQTQHFADTWAWDGLDWTQQTPAVSPPGRFFGGMAFDIARNRIVLYGGETSSLIGPNYFDDTWEYDGTTWTQISTANTPGGFLQNPGVAEVAMAYDLIGQCMVMYGGDIWGGFVPAPQMTFEYDGTNWIQTTPAVQPPSRSQAAMCSAPSLGGVLMFGGTNFNNPPGPNGEEIWDDTWVYAASTDTWTQIIPIGAVPTARAGASLLYDASTGFFVLHGGYTYVGGMISPLADTWVFDGASWIDVTSTFGGPAGPHVRFASAEAPGGCQIMFGGSTGVFGTLSNETWIQGCAAVAATFGAGCAGTWGVPALTATGAPTFGGSLDLTASNLDPAGGFAFLSAGFSDTTSALGPLPLSLQPYGLGAGCELLVSADATTLVANSSGTATFSLPVPAFIGIAGLELFYQCGSIDGGVPGGFAVSNGVASAMGY